MHTELYSISFPYSLLHIAPNAFSFCTKLQTVMVQNRFVDIDETAFEYSVNVIVKAAQFQQHIILPLKTVLNLYQQSFLPIIVS